MRFHVCMHSQINFLSISQTAEKLGGSGAPLKRGTVYSRVREGTLTSGIKVGRLTRWPEGEICEIAAAIAAGADSTQLRALVRNLQNRRAEALALLTATNAPSRAA